MLTVYKASAGSGKTFRLVLEYLKILLVRPDNYRNILAVTFTNKATAEMKERILEHLGKLAGGQNSPYLNILQQESALSEQQIRSKAQIILEKLLFDYDRFSVSTIDKFNQRILKAFNREIGINPNYLVETDTETLIAEAVDRIIAQSDQNPRLFSWLESFIEEKIRNNKSFTIETDIRKLGDELFKERLQNKLAPLTQFFRGNGNDRRYLDLLYKIIAAFEKQLEEQAGKLVSEWTNAGYLTGDFAYGSAGVAGFLEKMAQGKWNETIGVRVLKAAEAAENWVAAKNPSAAAIRILAEVKLRPGLISLLSYLDAESRSYFTAKAIAREWYSASVLIDLNEEIGVLSREKGILPLANSNLLLKGIIDGSDTPFIFEKAGNTWNYFLLDEFQDTSEMQWANFKPLISNSLSDDHPNMVVGDVKQSIYRWRNSDWNLLYRQIYDDFRYFPVMDVPLDSNFRSGQKIVEFNNNFFGYFSKVVAGYSKIAPAAELCRQIEEIYTGCRQEPAALDEPEGFVCIEQSGDPDTDFETASLERLVQQIRALYEKGFAPGDIAILVRKKDQGARIVRYFLDIARLTENQSIPLRILSGESLFLKTSPAVMFIVHLFRCLLDGQDKLSRAALLHLYRNFVVSAVLEDNSATTGGIAEWVVSPEWEDEFAISLQPLLDDISEKSVAMGLDELIVHVADSSGLFKIAAEIPFIQTLIDQTAELRKKNITGIPGFLEWWEEKGSEVSVRINDKVDAIRLLTIHSAKGLEFKVVLIPFLDWKIAGSSYKDILWCSPEQAPFNQAPLVPVRYSDQLAKTWFDGDYYRELANVLIDNLNLIYVAFTRAVSVLWINIPAQNDAGDIGSFIMQALMESLDQSGWEHTWNEQLKRFTFGEIPERIRIKDQHTGTKTSGWTFNDFSGKMVLRTESDDFLQKNDSGKSRKNLGKSLHAILAEIRTRGDVETACAKAVASGTLLPEEWTESVTLLLSMTEHPVAGDWFSGNWKVKTEADLLSSEMTLRPDRIMLKEDEAVIVDYKTGDMKQESHIRQVERYKKLLSETGISRVKGYLWYLQGNELVEV